MSWYSKYIILVILVKVVFVVLAVSHLVIKVKGKAESETDKKIIFWKERMEFIFIFLMSLLLIYLFNPRANRYANLDYETRILLYLFGFILLITAKWGAFIHENPLFKKFQGVV
jgi:hypothetical protein